MTQKLSVDPDLYQFSRRNKLPLEFRGWVRVSAERTEITASGSLITMLKVFETVASSWVTVTQIGYATADQENVITVHRSLKDAVAVLGTRPLDMEVRRQLGFPLVERLA